MSVLIQYSGVDARHGSGVDVGPSFIHLDLDGEPVEVPDDLGAALLRDQPGAFKVPVKKKEPVNEPPAEASEKKESGK